MTARRPVLLATLCLGAGAAPAAALQAPGRVAYPATGGRIFHDAGGAAAFRAFPLAGGGALLLGGKAVDVELMALDASGHLRQGFGRNGVAQPDLPVSVFLGALPRPDGGILLFGAQRNDFDMPPPAPTIIEGVTASGAADRSLGRDGAIDTGLYDAQVALARDGDLLVAGKAAGRRPSNDDVDAAPVVLDRLRPDGTRDLAFGDRGRVALPRPAALAVDATGRILLADGDLRALHQDGSPDPTFGADGSPATMDVVGTPTPRPDGSVDVVANDRITRYTAAGDVDRGFGQDGTVVLRSGPDTLPRLSGSYLTPSPTPEGGYVSARLDRSDGPASLTVRRVDPAGQVIVEPPVSVPSFGGGIGSNPDHDHSIPPYLQDRIPPLVQNGSYAGSMLQRSDGGLLLIGGVRVARPSGPSGSAGFFTATALTASGALDTSYGGPATRPRITLDRTAVRVSAPYDGGVRVSGRASGPGLVLLRVRTRRGGLVAQSLSPVYAAGRFSAVVTTRSNGRALMTAGRQVAIGAQFRGVLSGTARDQRSARLR